MEADFFDDVLPELPLILTRKDIGKFFGGLISRGYLANLDSRKQGPKMVRIGHKAGYRREDFIEWLRGRVKK